ncbi:MAG TPA: hypothetical protein VFO79_11985 [Xanthomonadales bacterium]|nr:hypothetical protein [Xanthomonadales bacterium]
MRSSVSSWCALVALASPVVATAATDPEIAALEARIAALEANADAMRRQADEAMAALSAARAEIEKLKTAAPAPAVAEAPAPVVAPAVASGTSSGNAFNPAISVVLDGQYSHHSLDTDAYERSGFPLAGEAGPGEDGLSLGESEIALSANVDDKFYGQLTVAIESEDGETELALEEAYVDTTALPAGFSLRAGRFFSNIGYLNTHHAHTDRFPDRPLAYQAFLGNQYLDDGVQVRWVAPTDIYLELGGELLRQNFPSGGAAHDGVGAHTLSVHAGGDVGVEHSWLAGISLLDSDTVDGEDGFTGDARLWIADLTWKWAPDGNAKDGGIQVRGEYFRDERDGDYVDALDPSLDQPWNGTRRGVYVEGIYRINRQWETGYRYDKLWADDTGPYASDHDPYRHGVVLTWLNSEFSLLRFLVARDKPNAVDTDTVLTLQYQVAFGAHGAHKF